MSQVRTSVGWVFGDILNCFAFLDFKKKLKIGLGSVGKMYIICALVRNSHTFFYRSSTCNCFEVDPTLLIQYLQ